MSGLRLDYFLSFGLKLSKGDECSDSQEPRAQVFQRVITDDDNEYNGEFEFSAGIYDDKQLKRLTITSLTQRKNTGEQPCGDDVPVRYEFANGEVGYCAARDLIWSLNGEEDDIATWQPAIAELIKMQYAHDKLRAQKQAEDDKATNNDSVINAVIMSNFDPIVVNDYLTEEFKAVNSRDYIADLKPRTKTTYVKVDKNAEGGRFWEVARDFESDGIYCISKVKEFALIKSDESLAYYYRAGNVYRKVETEINWKDELSNYISSCKSLCRDSFIKHGCFERERGVDVFDDEFIAMCQLVAELTDKPE